MPEESEAGVDRARNECPRCGSEGTQNPILDGWFECNRCVISFNVEGEVDDEQY